MDMKILKDIGLTDSEIKVYMALLKIGSSKKGPIVREAGISPSKLYDVMEKLVDKGLVSYVTKNNVMHFRAAPPARILDYVKEKQERLQRDGEELGKLLPELQKMRGAADSETDAEIFRGWKGMQTVYNDILETLSPGDGYCIFGASRGEDERRVRSFYTSFSIRAKRRGLKTIIIFNESARGNIEGVEKSAEVRYMKETTPSETVVYGDKTAIVLLEKEPMVILIRGRSIAESFRAYFSLMWNSSAR